MIEFQTSFPSCTFAQRSLPCRLVMGEGVVNTLPIELVDLGISKPMVLAGRRTSESRFYKQITDALGTMQWVAAAHIPAHSSLEIVQSLVALARKHSVDGFITVGGGSVVDTAKAVAILLAEGGDLKDHAVKFTPPDNLQIPELKAKKLPIVALPMTASGAEVTPSVGIRTPDGAKLLMSDPNVPAKLVILDRDGMREVPAAVLCSSAMNALAHCIEGLYSLERTPMAQTLALESIHRLHVALPAVVQDDSNLVARSYLLYAAHLAGQVLIHARTCLHHALCHVIGSVTGVSHGDANSVLLPHIVEFNAPFATQALQSAAAAVGVKGSDGLVLYLRQLQKHTKVPTRLRDLGIEQSALKNIANKAMHERGVYFNPRPVRDEKQLLALLDEAY